MEINFSLPPSADMKIFQTCLCTVLGTASWRSLLEWGSWSRSLKKSRSISAILCF